MQVSKCSPWGMGVKLFSSLRKKMKDYIQEHQAIANPFIPRSYPSRPNAPLFAKQPNATALKRNAMGTKCNNERLAKPRKIDVQHDLAPFQKNWLTQTIAQVLIVAILTHKEDISFTFAQLPTNSVVHTQPAITIPTRYPTNPNQDTVQPDTQLIPTRILCYMHTSREEMPYNIPYAP